MKYQVYSAGMPASQKVIDLLKVLRFILGQYVIKVEVEIYVIPATSGGVVTRKLFLRTLNIG